MKNLLLISIVLLNILILNACSSDHDITIDNNTVTSDVSNIDEVNSNNKVINNFTNELINPSSNVEQINGLPEWAKELGLVEPNNMILDKVNSSITSSANRNEAINSVTLIYHGDYDVAMKEAKRIAKSANVPLNKEFKIAQDLQNSLPDSLKTVEGLDTIKGVIYTNYEISTMRDIEYPITISVKEDGELTISTYNQKQLSDQE